MEAKEKPFIVPIFIPQQGCRHHCVFCNQSAITGRPATWPSTEEFRKWIKKYLTYNKYRKPPVMAFYGGNFLGLSQEKISCLLEMADEYIRRGEIQSIRFSTRPDTISETGLKRLEPFPVSEIELGVQSMDDKVLTICRRGHFAADTEHAVGRLKKYRYNVGLQLMIGLPGQSAESAWKTAEQTAALSPDFVRIYPTLVLTQSPLAKWYHEGTYRPLELKEAVFQTKRLYLFFRKHGIRVIRMGLQSSQELDDKKTVLAGPYHPAFGHLVLSEIYMDTICGFYNSNPPAHRTIDIIANPGCISRIRGIKNENVRHLEKRFNLDRINIKADPALSLQGLFIDRQWLDLQ